MERIPERELMDDPLQVKAYSQADFGSGDQFFIKNLQNHLNFYRKKIDSKSVIYDLGCGPGNISELLAAKWTESTVIGIDGSKEMLLEAKRRKSIHPCLSSSKSPSYVLGRISALLKQNLSAGPSPDVVVSNSLLHHLSNPFDLWHLIAALPSSKDTFTFHRDLRRPSSSNEVEVLQRRTFPDGPEILIRDFVASLHAAYSVLEVRAQLEQVGLSNFKVYEVDDRYLEVIGTVS